MSAREDEGQRVVITGIGVVTPLGNSVDLFWSRLTAGESGIASIERWDPSDLPVRFGGECKDFDPADWGIERREARRLDRFAHFALAASAQAVEDSGLDFSSLPPDRGGVIIGSSVGGIETMQDQYRTFLERGARRVSPFTIPRLMLNAATANVSIQYGVEGMSTSVATACSTGANAIAEGVKAIRSGECDHVIAGGSEAPLCVLGLAGFCASKALSMRNDDPSAASRPWDKDRDGFVLSEGAAVVTLERLDDARRRGARIYAELAGFGITSDARHITAPRQDGKGASASMRKALDNGGIDLDQVEYINAHGTSTPLGDVAENRAIKVTFGSHAHKLAVSSSKSQVGHLQGAAGALSIVINALALSHGVVPPTINLDEPGEECDLDYVPHDSRSLPIRCAISNSFGFGGHNTSLVLTRI